MKNFFIDFGFDAFEDVDPTIIKSKSANNNGNYIETIICCKKSGSGEKITWTILIYVFLSLGIFFRRTVNFPEPLSGINTSVFKWGIIAASFIIGLAVLAPLLRMISRFHKGKLSWHHCLTAFSIGFFVDLTFELIINGFVNVFK